MIRRSNLLSWAQKFASSARGIVPEVVRVQIETMVFNYVTKRIKKQVVINGKMNSPLVFCIVHWNAPDYLLLNVRQINLLYPESPIYVLDNRSQRKNFEAAKNNLEKFSNVTFFDARLQNPSFLTRLIVERLFDSYTHSKALQFLLYYSIEQSDEIAVFLDQDCIIVNKIDNLLAKFGKDVFLIGARDYVAIPHNYGPLRKGFYRDHGMFVHASFMILQPQRIKQLIENFSFETKNCFREPYHNISFRTLGKTLFLGTQMHETIPFLTRYMHQNVTYAWHAWYSTYSYRPWRIGAKLENYSLTWLEEVQKLAFDYLSQISIDNNGQVLARS